METRDATPPLPCSYAPLPAAEVTGNNGRSRRRPLAVAALVLSAALLLAVAALAGVRTSTTGMAIVAPPEQMMRSRGPNAGVSEKTSGADSVRLGDSGNAFPWSNAMLQWQRTGFHFQPEKN